MKNSKRLATLFSIIPGAGHMYLGLTRQGIELMTLFFFIFYLSTSLNIEFFALFLPIIWFFSIFDVRSKALSEGPLVDNDLAIFPNFNGTLLKENILMKYIGYVLVFTGIIALINNIVFPLIIDYTGFVEVRYIKSGFVSLVFITVGFMFLKNRDKNSIKKGAKNSCRGVE